ncbi:MAG: carboxypeptidase-like regulatory domain-containing protein, partial [Myxococcota bacterium]
MVVYPLVLAVAGCGFESSDGDVDPGTDAGMASCTTELVAIDADETAPTTLRYQAVTQTEGQLFGAATFTWEARRIDTGESLEVASDEPFGEAAQLAVTEPGPYRIIARGRIADTECVSASRHDNVRAPGALSQSYALQVTPPQGLSVRATESIMEVWGGANARYDDLVLHTAETLRGQVLDSAGQPVNGAAVRITPRPRGIVVERISDGSGRFSLLDSGDVLYDILVVPQNSATTPIALFESMELFPAENELRLTAGRMLTGSVRDSTGQPITGARVAVQVGPYPSAIADTSTDGQFALVVASEIGAPIGVVVIPPSGSALPTLSAP